MRSTTSPGVLMNGTRHSVSCARAVPAAATTNRPRSARTGKTLAKKRTRLAPGPIFGAESLLLGFVGLLVHLRLALALALGLGFLLAFGLLRGLRLVFLRLSGRRRGGRGVGLRRLGE